jgi:hypothetical protein
MNGRQNPGTASLGCRLPAYSTRKKNFWLGVRLSPFGKSLIFIDSLYKASLKETRKETRERIFYQDQEWQTGIIAPHSQYFFAATECLFLAGNDTICNRSKNILGHHGKYRMLRVWSSGRSK